MLQAAELMRPDTCSAKADPFRYSEGLSFLLSFTAAQWICSSPAFVTLGKSWLELGWVNIDPFQAIFSFCNLHLLLCLCPELIQLSLVLQQAHS